MDSLYLRENLEREIYYEQPLHRPRPVSARDRVAVGRYPVAVLVRGGGGDGVAMSVDFRPLYWSNEPNPEHSATVAPIVRQPVRALRHIVCPRTARLALGFSLSEMGRELGKVHPNGHGGRAYHKSAVAHWERGDYRMTADTQEAYRRVIESAANVAGLKVKVKFGRAWSFRPMRVCECGRELEVKINEKKCVRCRR